MVKKLMNLTEYAAHVNRSIPLISRWCRPDGKLSKAIKKSGKRKLLRVKIADAILEVSMDLSQQRLTAGNDHQQNIPSKQVADHLVEGKTPKQSSDKTGLALTAWVDEKNTKRCDDKTEIPKGKYSYQDALIKDKYYAAALKKLDLDQKNGILVLKVDVEKESFECARMVRDALQNISSRVAAVLAAMTTEAEIEKLLDKEIRQSLEALAK